ncbi:recombinase RecT [Corynebacterium phocae]|uniref:recombinase RecT n=1 Tax=Corynebacterium phocae TaxID=161895 RepID=UPI000951908B|nr:recombinase RecT [Corynebacterium phocae]KAA8723018.1 recombinase RecT [Corynebacterium phocae]
MSENIPENQDLVGTEEDRGVYRAGAESDFTPAERDRLRALGGLDEASDGDLAMLFEVAQRTGLDPFLKEIYLIGRKTKTGGYRGEPERWETKWSVQTGIDGFKRVLFRFAESKGVAHMIGAPRFFDSDGNEYPFWPKKVGPHPEAVMIDVRVGESVGTGIATWSEFCQTKKNGEPTAMWDKLGPTMLAKCATAQAIRNVCHLAAGIYVDAEMAQSAPRVQATATRRDKPALGAAGFDAAFGREETPEPAALPSPESSPLVQEALAGLAGFTSREEVGEYVEAVRGSDEFQPEELAVVEEKAREMWKKLGDENE